MAEPRTFVLTDLRGLLTDDSLTLSQDHEEKEDIRMYMDLGIPDEMLSSFAKRYPINELLATAQGPTFLRYKRREQTWMATVYDYFHLPGKKARQLTIKLSHNGFRYHHRKYTSSKITTHELGEWCTLGSDVLNDMPYLAQLKTEIQAEIVFFYNIKHKRIDIHFFHSFLHETPFLMITFETGNPVSDIPRELRF